EGEAGREAAIGLHLQGVIVRIRVKLDVVDVAVALVRTQEIIRQRGRPARNGWINARGLEALPIGHRIDAAPLQKVVRQRAGVGHVDYRVEAYVALDAEAEVVDRRRIIVPLDADDPCR